MNAKLRNLIVFIYQNTLYRFRQKRNYSLISRNSRFRNVHENDRCFIIGNGPSLRNQDLSALKNKYVFTVNQAARNSQFSVLCSNYHFCVDQTFFRDDPNDPGVQEFIETLKKVNSNESREKPECFFPVNQEAFIKKYKLDKELKINYLSMQYIVTDDKFPIDLSKPIPRFQTVVQTCIVAAIYMGFTEIYLLGCDNTGIIANINSFLKKDCSNDYAYNISDNEKDRMQKLFTNQKLEDYVLAYYKTLVNYSNIAEYCKRNGILLKNCSLESTIDSIDMINLDEVVK